MIEHKTTIHGRCPINGSWDYYELTVRTDQFVKCEDIEKACDAVRGLEITQEEMATRLRDLIGTGCGLCLQGRHGQNVQTTVRI